MISALLADFLGNSTQVKITANFTEYAASLSKRLVIPSLHVTAQLGNVSVPGSSLDLVYVPAGVMDLANATLVWTTAATRVDGGGVVRFFSDKEGIAIPAAQDVFLRIPANVTGGFKVYADFEWQVRGR